MRITAQRTGTIIFVSFLILGCSRGEHPELRPVTGTVTYLGQPVGGATVAFYNDESARLASGQTDAEGMFSLTSYNPNDGALPGKHKVVVRKVDTDDAEMPSLSMDEALKSRPKPAAKTRFALPKRYASRETTPLVVMISEEGVNDLVLEIED